MAIADQFVPNLTDGSANPAPVPYQEILVNGAITIAAGTVTITKATAAAVTIDAPPTTMNGAVLVIASDTAAAHVITSPTVGFNKKGSSGTLTFAATIGVTAVLVARNGQWLAAPMPSVTIA